MEEKNNIKDTASPFLLNKGLPATEREFFNKYGITRKKAKGILDQIASKIETNNPKLGKINHTRMWSPKNLEKLFNFAGHNYEQLIINIQKAEFKTFSPNNFINQICKE